MIRKAVFIVGMGRSGTSAIARVLGLCGAALPEMLMAPNRGNPTGYWESQRAVDVNDDFLKRHQSSWYDVRLNEERDRSLPADERAQFIERICQVIEADFREAPLIVIKDPRISGLLPYWLEGAAAAGYESAAVQPFRHPAEVAASLARRDRLTQEHSDALWLKYNLLAERQTRGLRRVFIPFGDILADWQAVMTKTGGALDLPLLELTSPVETVNEFLRHDLRHHLESLPPAGGPEDLVRRVYEWLRAAAESDAGRPLILDKALDRYRTWCETSAALSLPRDHDPIAASVATLDADDKNVIAPAAEMSNSRTDKGEAPG